MKTLPKKIKQVLGKIEASGFHLTSDPETIIADETRNNFIATLTKNGTKFFLKTRLSPKAKFKKRIRREIIFYQYLKKEKASLYQFIPGLVEGQIGEVDYYITKFCKGKNLGSRINLDENTLPEEKLPTIFAILKSMQAIDSSKLLKTQYFQVRTSAYHENYFEKRVQIYSRFLEPDLVSQVKRFVFSTKFKKWLDRSAKTISHGDFQTPNFIDTSSTIKVVDWDNVGIDNPLFDRVYFWVHSWQRPELRRAFIKSYLKAEDQAYFLSLAAYLLLIQVAALRGFLHQPSDYANDKEVKRRKKGCQHHEATLEKILKGQFNFMAS